MSDACSRCGGSGEITIRNGEERTCPKCGGSGVDSSKVSQYGASHGEDDNPSLFSSGD